MAALLKRGPGNVGRALIAGGCPKTNVKIYIVGSPTGGNFKLKVTCNGHEETYTIQWNENVGTLQSKLESHPEIDAGDVTVSSSGGAFPNQSYLIESGAEITFVAETNDFNLTGGFGVYVYLDRCTC